MIIRQIKIENKWPIKRADIKLKKGLNIIIGKNATGKTTLLNELKKLEKKPEHDKDCWILDDLYEGKPISELKEIVKGIMGERLQVILTMPDSPEIRKLDANIIDTKNFELR